MSDFKLSDLKKDVEKNSQKKQIKTIVISAILVSLFALIIVVVTFIISSSSSSKDVPVITGKNDPNNDYNFACEYLNTDNDGYYCSLENDDVISIYYDRKTGKIEYIGYNIELPNFTTKEEALDYATVMILEYQSVIKEANPDLQNEDMLEIDDPFFTFRDSFIQADASQDINTEITLVSNTSIRTSYYSNSNSFYITVSNYGY